MPDRRAEFDAAALPRHPSHSSPRICSAPELCHSLLLSASSDSFRRARRNMAATLELDGNNNNNQRVPDQLVDQLVKGYDALSVEIRVLDEQRRELENRLSWAKQQVRLLRFLLCLYHPRTLHDEPFSSRPVAAQAARNDKLHVIT